MSRDATDLLIQYFHMGLQVANKSGRETYKVD